MDEHNLKEKSLGKRTAVTEREKLEDEGIYCGDTFALMKRDLGQVRSEADLTHSELHCDESSGRCLEMTPAALPIHPPIKHTKLLLLPSQHQSIKVKLINRS